MPRPDDIEGYEEFAESEALFDEGDIVIYDPAPGVVPAQKGKIKWRRWERGNRSWAYSVALDDGGGTMAIEQWIKPRVAREPDADVGYNAGSYRETFG